MPALADLSRASAILAHRAPSIEVPAFAETTVAY